MKKILVTGGAGYLGSLLIPTLLKDNKVTIFDNFSWGVRSILHFAGHKNLEIITGDIRNEKEVREVVKDKDLIIHLAAIVGYPACSMDTMRAKSTNVVGTKNIISNLSRSQELVFASTGSTYGSVKYTATEETPIEPLTLYGSTKAESEKMSMDFGAVSLRFATVFGVSPRLRIDLLINDFTYLAIHKKEIVLFEGGNRRTFIHCADAAKSIKFASDNFSKMKDNVYNVGDDSLNLTKREVALKLKEKINFYLHEAETGEDPDKRDYEVSYKKLANEGFKCDMTFDDGLNELIKVLTHIKMFSEWRNH